MRSVEVNLRYGIIGTGMMGCEHIRNLASIAGARVAALADPHAESLQRGLEACAERAGGVETYADPLEMLERASLDAVVVASPNHRHAEILDALFETDLHVLVEKPMCTTLEDCRRVLSRAAEHRGVFQVGLEYRHMAPVAAFLSALEAGAVGRLKMLFIREHRFPFLPKVEHWNRFNRNSGGTLVEKCCHFFDLMNLAIGADPIRVFASGGQDVNHLDESYDGEVPDILDNAFVLIDYANGVRACLDLCMFAEGGRNEQELVATGDGGKLECTLPGAELVTSTRRYRDFRVEKIPADPRVIHTGLHHGASFIEHLDFLAAIREGRRATIGAAEGLRSVALGVAAQHSIEEGRAIPMAELLA